MKTEGMIILLINNYKYYNYGSSPDIILMSSLDYYEFIDYLTGVSNVHFIADSSLKFMGVGVMHTVSLPKGEIKVLKDFTIK